VSFDTDRINFEAIGKSSTALTAAASRRPLCTELHSFELDELTLHRMPTSAPRRLSWRAQNAPWTSAGGL